MKKTKLVQTLGISHPIFQAGLSWVASAELAAAVSNAGGLGALAPNAGMPLKGSLVQNLRAQIAAVRKLTGQPFGVHIPISAPSANALVDTVIGEEVKVVISSGGSPAFYTGRFKDAEITVLHVVTSVREAQAAEALGVDAVIALGYESGGILGAEPIPTFVLVPAVADAVDIPVVAAGGIVDGRGLVAALALGAQAVQMTTRFIATEECVAHPKFKEAVVKAVETDTVVTFRHFRPRRLLRGSLATELLRKEEEGASERELLKVLGSDRLRAALLQGDLEQGELPCGIAAGLVTEVLPAAEVIQRTIKQAEEMLGRLR
jgi:enoyl-[acyl-carrier protein] reductase II